MNVALEHYFNAMPDGYEPDIQLDHLANRFENCSMRDIRRFCEVLTDIGICKAISQPGHPISNKDIEEAWHDTNPTPLDQKNITRYEKLASTFA